MAAAYAALVSLSHLIEHSLVHNARRPIFLDEQQRQVESLQQKVSFLQDFLEVYSHGGSNEAQGLECRIADAAHAAQNVIESHVVDTIVSKAPKKQSKNKNNQKINFSSLWGNSFNHFSQGLRKVIQNIDWIRREVMEIKGKSGVKDHQPNYDLVPVVSSRPEKDTMVEYNHDYMEQILDKLTGQSSKLQTISIVGMGGIGKTTLAANIYHSSLIVECFDIRAWLTISQVYSMQEILIGLLREVGVLNNVGEQESDEYHWLGEKLHKHLSGRKYLIVMDDIWSIDVWEKLKVFLPDNENGSRVMATTRLSDVADSFTRVYKMNLLDENKSWSLLRRSIFGHDGSCPPELEEIGKDVAKNCRGLPLSIVVIGGFLAKSEMTRKYWEYVAEDISQIVNTEDDGRSLKILSLSYSHLPIHLKPCFLYMGMYPEDREIHVTELIKLWVGEGFLKPNKSQSLEEVAEYYLNDLFQRNLILVREWGSLGNMKTCGIHDLLRDLCLKEAKKERFFCVVKQQNHPHSVNNSRVVFDIGAFPDRDSHQFHRVLQSTPFIHSFIYDDHRWNSSWESIPNLRLLRVLTDVRSGDGLNSILQLVNLRYLSFHFTDITSVDLSQMCRLWYLQTLIIAGGLDEINAAAEIWEMPQLRHIIVEDGICLPNPLPVHDDPVLENLQTLNFIRDFKCSEEVVKRILNIKELAIVMPFDAATSDYSLFNLGSLHKLQSLTINFLGNHTLYHQILFPQSLRMLSLFYCNFDWDDLTEKVGSLRHLGKLKLVDCHGGAGWSTVEGKFPRLKYLKIIDSGDLVRWTAESSHFPLLERLVLINVTQLEEIPFGIGDTLQSIVLEFCGSSVIASAQAMVEEQQSLGNEDLRLIIEAEIPDSALFGAELCLETSFV